MASPKPRAPDPNRDPVRPPEPTRLKVDTLTIRNFRNIAALDVEVPASGVVIIGANGEGKTNLLESIYYLVLFRSLRGATDRELVRFGTDGFFVAASADSRITAGFDTNGGKKKVTVDGVVANRLGDVVGQLAAVPFSPADREIVSGGPAGRRRYLDVLLALSDRSYFRYLSGMRSALKQRNAALRQGKTTDAKAFDRALAEPASQVAQRRIAWIEEWGDRFTEVCHLLGEEKSPGIRYRARVWEPAHGSDGLLQLLAEQLDRDVRQGATTIGPHRDDLVFELAGRSLRTFGSAGQQRTAAVALRILEGETLQKETGKTPIGLYDDIFVELDRNRQERLLGLIQDSLPGQAIMVAPRESEIPQGLFDRPRWTMSGGVVAAA